MSGIVRVVYSCEIAAPGKNSAIKQAIKEFEKVLDSGEYIKEIVAEGRTEDKRWAGGTSHGSSFRGPLPYVEIKIIKK